MEQHVTSETSGERQAIRDAVRTLCRDFPDPYWRAIDKEEKYPEEFVSALTQSGYLAALIPEEYGGAGLADYRYNAVMIEELSRRCFTGIGFAIHNDIVIPYLLRYATPAQLDAMAGEVLDGLTMSWKTSSKDFSSKSGRRARK